MIKYGEVTTDSQSDFEFGKKAEYFDADGTGVADAANKHKLATPIKIEKKSKEIEE